MDVIQRTHAGIEIEKARRRRGWKPAEVVLAVGSHPRLNKKKHAFSEATLRHIESGRVKDPGVHIQFAIATVLELDVIDLWPPKGTDQ